MSRVVVIGAGLGGLAVAVRLAFQGHDVTVCEASSQVGGKLGELVADCAGIGSFRFDTGPSLLTWPSVLRALFEQTGGWPHDLVLQPLEPLTRYRFGDGSTLDASSDPALMRARVEALRPGNGAEWERFTSRARRAFEASEQPFLSAPVSPAGLAQLALTRPADLAAIAPWRTLRGVAAAELTDPRLLAYVDRFATYTGSDPRRAPAALTAVPHVEHAFGGWHVEGGLRRIAEALLARALALGVQVRCHSPVTRVLVVDGRASGVLVGEHVLPADVVVSDVEAAHLYGDLVRVPRAARRLARATPSSSGFVLLLALRGSTPGLAHHNVWFPADYDEEFDAVFGEPARPVADPTVYVCAPADAAPTGHEAWFVLVNAARHGTGRGALDWTTAAPAYEQVLLDRLGVRDRVLWSRAMSPVEVGPIYGTSSNGTRAAFLRPANRSPLPGLLLVGGSAHPGGGIPLVLRSAEIAAGLLPR